MYKGKCALAIKAGGYDLHQTDTVENRYFYLKLQVLSFLFSRTPSYDVQCTFHIYMHFKDQHITFHIVSPSG